MNLIKDQGSLFSSSQQGMSVTEWEEIQEEIKVRIFSRYTRSKAIWIPGNVPSLKNSKEIIQIWRTKSNCCKADIYRTKVNGYLKAFCSTCRAEQNAKRPIITASKVVKKYQEATYEIYKDNRYIWNVLTAGMKPPYIVGIYHVRDSKRKFDYGNASEIIQDTMTHTGYWEDDNMELCIPVHLGFTVDPKAPGVFIIPLPKPFMREIVKMI